MTQETVDSGDRQRSGWGRQPLLVAMTAVLVWDAVALTGWLAYAFLITRADPDWGDLVAIVMAAMGIGGFLVSLLIAGVVVGLWQRRGRWAQQQLPPGRAFGYGTVAAAIGLAPFVIYVIGAALIA